MILILFVFQIIGDFSINFYLTELNYIYFADFPSFWLDKLFDRLVFKRAIQTKNLTN